jgi:4-carboxymuconolactone decarboxylase
MTRLRRFARDSLTAEQRALYDEIVGSQRPGQQTPRPRVGPDTALEGPFNARLLNPAIGHAFQQIADAVRYQSTLTDRIRELVILVVAAAWESTYVQYAHEEMGRSAGLTDAELTAVAHGGVPDVEEHERAAITVARALVAHSDLSDDEYAEAVSELGERKLFEVLALVGLYTQTALQLRVFRVIPPRHSPDQLDGTPQGDVN